MVLHRVATSAFVHEVLYIGSAIPLETSEGLEAVQQPLRYRYPVNNEDNIQGMMARLEIQSEGIQLKFKDDGSQVVLFPYSSLNLCAAVRCVNVADDKTKEMKPKFVSLTSPEAGGVNSEKPAIFTAITRRTKGRQVLECHGFITMHPKDALDLVRWVNQFDKKSKQEGMTSFSSATTPRDALDSSASQAGFNFSSDGDITTLDGYPVKLAPGAPVEPNAGPTFYEEQPQNGYFYTTNKAGVKKYSLEKIQSGGGADTIETRSVIAGSVLNGADDSVPPGFDITDPKPRGYAGSTVSAPAYRMPPRQPYMMPVGYMRPPPMYMRPMMYGPPPPSMYGYPRRPFIAPPGSEMMRAHPVPVMIPGPQPGGYYPPPPRRRNSRGSSPSDRSSSGGSPRVPRNKAKQRPKSGAAATNREESSDGSSRPHSPPTDYDQPKGPRVSRKDGYLKQDRRSVSPALSAPLYPPPHGYYMMPPQYGYYPVHPAMMARNHSLPPNTERGKEKKSKKKSKKDPKPKNKGKENTTFKEYDESADSVGYQSEAGQNNLPFRRFQNQFQHERAFSKSLAEEIKKSDGSLGRNAYNLNANEAAEMPLF